MSKEIHKLLDNDPNHLIDRGVVPVNGAQWVTDKSYLKWYSQQHDLNRSDWQGPNFHALGQMWTPENTKHHFVLFNRRDGGLYWDGPGIRLKPHDLHILLMVSGVFQTLAQVDPIGLLQKAQNIVLMRESMAHQQLSDLQQLFRLNTQDMLGLFEKMRSGEWADVYKKQAFSKTKSGDTRTTAWQTEEHQLPIPPGLDLGQQLYYKVVIEPLIIRDSAHAAMSVAGSTRGSTAWYESDESGARGGATGKNAFGFAASRSTQFDIGGSTHTSKGIQNASRKHFPNK